MSIFCFQNSTGRKKRGLSVLSLPGTTFASFASFCCLRTWFGICHGGAPPIWLVRNVGGSTFAARVLVTVASSQGHDFLSFGCLWKWLWILGGWYLLYPLWGSLLCPWSCSELPEIFTVCLGWNLVRCLKAFLKKYLCGQKLAKLEADIQSLIKSVF